MQNDDLQTSIDDARDAAQQGDFALAADIQAQVIAQLRQTARTPDDIVMLGVQLFNLADYYTGLERFPEAIQVMEEVVALDEQIGHPDIDSDKMMLAQVRKLAAMTPQARRDFYINTPQSQPTVSYLADPIRDMISQMDSLSPEEREELETLVRQMQGMTPEQQVNKALEMMQARDDKK